MRNRPTVVLTDFDVVRPRMVCPQEDLLRWLALAHAKAEAAAAGAAAPDPAMLEQMSKLLARFGCSPRRIQFRGTEVLDARAADFAEMEIYRIAPALWVEPRSISASPNGVGAAERTRFFAKRALEVFERLYPPGGQGPDQLIHVTCTGYQSPSAAQRIVDLRGWHGRTTVTHAYHMGCYAALSAVRLAEGLVAAEPARVDIVHTEMCSLHMNPIDHDPEQIVVQSLFADGHIKYSVLPTDEQRGGFVLLATHEHILPGTQENMSWSSADFGMQMTLAKAVPGRIAGALTGFLEALSAKAGISPAALLSTDVSGTAIFAVHPGGPKIIDSVQEILGLKEWQVRHSKSVLFNCGNMSSATLPHIWSALLADPAVGDGRLVVSLAFGPGLTLFGSVLRKSGGEPITRRSRP